MLIDVALMPSLARNWRRPVALVIDVLRASSTLPLMLARGAGRVFPVADIEAARQKAAELGALLAGERGGVAPDDFDLGNSPAKLQHMDLKGRDVVFTTSNGTQAIASVPHAAKVLMGSFNNAGACCAAALSFAREQGGMIGLVCAGQGGGFALDDGVCAGYLVSRLQQLSSGQCHLTDAAVAMRQLHDSFGDVGQAFELTASAANLRQIGDGDDLAFCARCDISQVAPVLNADGYFAPSPEVG